jgi:2-polyprenyl-3-methyl-5-hydroxy-6-metoxy-1,4-benzoquinol methylase
VGTRAFLPDHDDYDEGLERMAHYRSEWASEGAGLVRNMRLVEIGSGDGRTLAAFAARGLDCTGIEPDIEEAKASLRRLPSGVRVHACAAEDAPLDPPYDVLVAFHVLEHLHDPIETLARWRSLLTPRGALCVEVPNVFAPSLPVDPMHWQWVHLYEFRAHTLHACLVRAGLEVVQSHVGSRLRLVARPASSPGQVRIPHGGQYVQGFLDAVRAYA